MRKVKRTLGIALATVLAAGGAGAQEAAKRPPNVIVILADDLGYNDISLHGNTLVRTPNIDRIGTEGVRFTRGHTTNATCSPSRAGLLTGRNQQRYGYEFVAAPADFTHALDGTLNGRDEGHIIVDIPPDKQVPLAEMGIPPSETTIAELLKTAGYRTGAVGKWHVGSAKKFRPDHQGFDFFTGMLQGAGLFAPEDDPNVVNAKLPWDGIDMFLWSVLDNKVLRDGRPYQPEEYMTTFLGKEAVRFIDESKDQPFFLYLAFNAPHTPLQAPKANYDRLTYIADPKTRVYYAMIESMDEAVGQVLDHLKGLGLEENTIVVFTSDNGAAPYTRIPMTNLPFRGAKATYYQGGVVVPFLMKWPGVIEPGTVKAEPVSLLDVFPTVAKAAGAALPRETELDGVDLLPFVRGESAQAPHEALVWRSGGYRAILLGDYRLQIDGLQKRTMLHNIRTDVGERVNLAESMPEKVAELRAVLEKAEAQFLDPLWPTPAYGKVPADVWPDEMPADAEYIYFPV